MLDLLSKAMDCRLITFLVLCFGLCAANDKGNVIEELKSLKERVNKLETLTENLLNGHVKRLDPSYPNVAFDAVLSKNYVHGEQDFVLKFDQVLTNVGNAYNSATGTFTAPFPGTYLFSWNIRSGYVSSIVAKLMVNGTPVQATHTDSSLNQSNGFEAHSSKTAILNLQQNDRVYIENFPQRGQIHSDANGHTGFVGTLLFQSE
ncbi:complement C1q-like protein 4 [Mytilus trossulus]|uniref:complement C1q-like protein 4 n=1 Tax=Mytilus trossulus TaxID=6551 RepID=UPI0030063244